MRNLRLKKSALILSALIVSVFLCAFTWKVSIGGKRIPRDQASIRCILKAEELSKLDKLTALQYADLSGSTCYDEIDAWALAHPQTEVHYSVTFPDGTTADNFAESLALPGLTAETANDAFALLRHFPKLASLSLTGSDLTAATVSRFASELPDVRIEYDFALFGRAISFDGEEIDLSGISSAELESAASALAALPAIKRVKLGSSAETKLTWDEIALLEASRPEAEFEYAFTLYDRPFNLADTEMDLNHIPIDDGGELVGRVVACMPKLQVLDMDCCGVADADMERLRNENPEVNVIWRIWAGDTYSVRTDVERILMSNPSTAGNLTDKLTVSLKYCTKVKYMDIGHNELLTDLSFVAYMPELEVLIVAMNKISDLSPLANCKKLEYLEIQTNEIYDLSPLAGLTELKHLNCARNYITDISPLFGMTKLERAWLGSSTKCPPEQLEKLQEIAPDCEINTYVYNDPTEGRWRYIGSNPAPWSMEVYLHPRYELLQEQFGYEREDFSFYWNDPKFY